MKDKILEFGENHFFGDCYLKWEQMKEFINALSENNRTFSGEVEPETKLAELTQFNSEGEKITHTVYHLP